MVKRLAVACTLLALVAGRLCAEDAAKGPWRLGASVGYTTVSFSAVRSALEDFLKAKGTSFVDYLYATSSHGSATVKLEYPKGATALDAELFYMVAEGVGLGGKFGYLVIPTFKGSVRGSGAYGESIEYSLAMDTSLIALLFGLYAETEIRPGAISLGGKALVGPVLANATINQSQAFVDPYFPAFARANSFSGEYDISGSGVGYEVCASAVFGINDSMSTFLELSWRGARLPEMTKDADEDLDGDSVHEIRKGEKFTDKDDDAVSFDFSGLSIALGLRFMI